MVFDPRGWMLKTVDFDKPTAEWIVQLRGPLPFRAKLEALRALGRAGGAEAEAALGRRVARGAPSTARAAAAEAWERPGRRRPPAALEALRPGLADRDSHVRTEASKRSEGSRASRSWSPSSPGAGGDASTTSAPPPPRRSASSAIAAAWPPRRSSARSAAESYREVIRSAAIKALAALGERRAYGRAERLAAYGSPPRQPRRRPPRDGHPGADERRPEAARGDPPEARGLPRRSLLHGPVRRLRRAGRARRPGRRPGARAGGEAEADFEERQRAAKAAAKLRGDREKGEERAESPRRPPGRRTDPTSLPLTIYRVALVSSCWLSTEEERDGDDEDEKRGGPYFPPGRPRARRGAVARRFARAGGGGEAGRGLGLSDAGARRGIRRARVLPRLRHGPRPQGRHQEWQERDRSGGMAEPALGASRSCSSRGCRSSTTPAPTRCSGRPATSLHGRGEARADHHRDGHEGDPALHPRDAPPAECWSSPAATSSRRAETPG